MFTYKSTNKFPPGQTNRGNLFCQNFQTQKFIVLELIPLQLLLVGIYQIFGKRQYGVKMAGGEPLIKMIPAEFVLIEAFAVI